MREEFFFDEEKYEFNVTYSSYLGAGTDGKVWKFLFLIIDKKTGQSKEFYYAGKSFIEKKKKAKKEIMKTNFHILKKLRKNGLIKFSFRIFKDKKTIKFRDDNLDVSHILFYKDLESLPDIESILPINHYESFNPNLKGALTEVERIQVYSEVLSQLKTIVVTSRIKIKHIDCWIIAKTKNGVKTYLMDVSKLEELAPFTDAKGKYATLLGEFENFLIGEDESVKQIMKEKIEEYKLNIYK